MPEHERVLLARVERERDEARAERDRAEDQANNLAADLIATERERDAALNHLQAVRELAHGLGASTATRNEILDACTRMPFAPEAGS